MKNRYYYDLKEIQRVFVTWTRRIFDESFPIFVSACDYIMRRVYVNLTATQVRSSSGIVVLSFNKEKWKSAICETATFAPSLGAQTRGND